MWYLRNSCPTLNILLSVSIFRLIPEHIASVHICPALSRLACQDIFTTLLAQEAEWPHPHSFCHRYTGDGRHSEPTHQQLDQ